MNALLGKVEAGMKRLSPRVWFLTGLAFVLLVATVDFSTPPGMSFTLFYLLAVTFVAWSCGRWQALVLALISAAVIAVVEWRILRGYLPRGAFLVWNGLTRFVVFSLVGLLIAEVTRLTRNLRSLVEERTKQWKAEAEQHCQTLGRLTEALQTFERQAWILENMAEGMTATDAKGVIELTNPAAEKLTGYSSEELRGCNVTMLSPFSKEETALRFGKLLSEVSVAAEWFGELPVRRKDGSQFVAQVTITTMKLGTKEMLVALYQDITPRKTAETELRNREELLRLGLEAARMLTWELDVVTGAIRCSENLPDFVGGTDVQAFQSLTGLLQRVHSEDRSATAAALDRALTDPNVLEHEYRTLHLDGNYHWILTKGRAIRDEAGRAVRLRGVSLDVSDRKQADFATKAQRDLAIALGVTTDLKAGLDKLLDTAVRMPGVDCGGVYLVNPQNQGLRLAVHRRLSDTFVNRVSDYSPDSTEVRLVAQRKPIYTVHEEMPRTVDLAREAEGLKAIAILPLEHEGELLGALNLGSHLHIEIPAHTRIVIETIAAQAAGAIARIRAETALHESEERLRTIINGAPLMLFATDRNGNIQFEDGQALNALGVAPGANVGRPLQAAYARYPAFVEQMRRALSGEVFSSTLEMGAASFYSWCSPARDKDGNITGYIGVATNVTERQLLERQLLEISDREQARIGQEIHDGLCQQLVSLAFDANSLQRQLLAKHRPEAKAAARLAEYLDLSISESRQLARGLFPIRLEADGLPSALEELTASTSARFRVGCRFEHEPQVTIRSQSAATHLFRIAQEAVNNAVKHSGAKEIVIGLRRTASGVELSITDNGHGFRPDPVSAGNGMGLHIMDYRARSLRATFGHSSSPSDGTKVWCCVPDGSQ